VNTWSMVGMVEQHGRRDITRLAGSHGHGLRLSPLYAIHSSALPAITALPAQFTPWLIRRESDDGRIMNGKVREASISYHRPNTLPTILLLPVLVRCC
jgi:hypothetical protein